MSQSLILIDVLSSAFWEKKQKNTKPEVARRSFSRAGGWTLLAGCAGQDFRGC
jgi:hypothetical protein